MYDTYRRYLSSTPDWSNFGEYLRSVRPDICLGIRGGLLTQVLVPMGDKPAVLVAARLLLSHRSVTARKEKHLSNLVLREEFLARREVLAMIEELDAEGRCARLNAKFRQSASAEHAYTQNRMDAISRWPEIVCSYDLEQGKEPDYGPTLGTGSRPHSSWTSAAGEWFGLSAQFNNNLPYKHRLLIVVPDRRGRVLSLSPTLESIAVKTEGTVRRHVLELHYVFRHGLTEISAGSVRVKHGIEAALPRPPEASGLDLWLLQRPRTILSHLTAHGASLRPALGPSPESSELAEREINGGENDNVELKPFAKDRSKIIEILESIAAFANVGGGNVYVGVTDKCVMEGSGTLCRIFGSDIVRAKQEQLHSVRSVAADYLEPVPEYELTWMALGPGGDPVLRVAVPPSEQVHALHGGTVLVRRSGNDRRATRSELEELFRTRRASTNVSDSDDEIW